MVCRSFIVVVMEYEINANVFLLVYIQPERVFLITISLFATLISLTFRFRLHQLCCFTSYIGFVVMIKNYFRFPCKSFYFILVLKLKFAFYYNYNTISMI